MKRHCWFNSESIVNCSELPVPFHCQDTRIILHHDYPIFNCDPRRALTGYKICSEYSKCRGSVDTSISVASELNQLVNVLLVLRIAPGMFNVVKVPNCIGAGQYGIGKDGCGLRYLSTF